MRAYKLIEKVLNEKDYSVLKQNEWLRLLFLKEGTDDINVENFEKISQITNLSTLEYVYKTLCILEEESKVAELTDAEYAIIEDVLCWSEVAKCGSKKIRQEWREKNFLLDIHNVGSSQIYEDFNRGKIPHRWLEYVSTLISTHGLIGQYLRGEVSIYKNSPLAFAHYPYTDHIKILEILNKCIVKAISSDLYDSIKVDIDATISDIIDLEFNALTVYERLERLRSKSIQNGEDFKAGYEETIKSCAGIESLLSNLIHYDFWYVESALSNFRTQDFLKLLAYVLENIDLVQITDISFGSFMNLYCDHEERKVINIFKQRMVEDLIKNHKLNSNTIMENKNVSIVLEVKPPVLNVKVQFSEIAEAFLNFCTKSTGQDALYDKVIFMACDEFGIRRDQYDRLYNEASYLDTMDESLQFKKPLLDYITGDTVVDIGPAGGSLMDAIEEMYPDKEIIGVDVSDNVIEALTARKKKEGHSWSAVKGNAFKLDNIFKVGDVDTFVFSSVLHEIFSYPTLTDQPFNFDAIKTALCSVYKVLPVGGRLIIRDGIMTDSFEKRIIKFKNPNDIEILEQYVKDFKGRKISYSVVGPNCVQMDINDSMEFLYTYTWGKESYAQEVKEQFGYFTPSNYVNFVKECFEGNAKVIKAEHFLQEGYSVHLHEKIDFFDQDMRPVKLPDSTFILVVEKI